MIQLNWRKLLLSISVLMILFADIRAQGWEENYGGVMLQGFYNDSFEDSKWTNLTSQAEELSTYFDLIWVPNSSTSEDEMGNKPQYWFKHESAFGSSTELRKMIKIFKYKGTGIIADVVLNHRSGVNSLYEFPEETDHNGNTWLLDLSAICEDDELAYTEGQPKPTGAYDEGDGFDGSCDLDHNNTYVQNAIKAYLDFLLNDLGYAGFRYDMVKGYATYYVGLYNAAIKAKYSVGDYFDGNYDAVKGWINGTIRDNNIQSGAFDFPLRFSMKEAFSSPVDLSKLCTNYAGTNQPNGLIKESNFRRYSVTFIDNHDTFVEGLKFNNDSYIVAANAFILCHPGTPCVFLPHWQAHKEDIKHLINVRKSVGIHNQSNIEVYEAQTDMYVAKVSGNNGDLIIKVGSGDFTPDGFNSDDIVASGEGYCVWSKVVINNSDNKAIPTNDGNGISIYVKKSSVPETWNSVYCYGWFDNDEYTSPFPGTMVTKTVSIAGEEYYKYTFDSSVEALNVVFSNGEDSLSADIMEISSDAYYSFSTENNKGEYEVTPIEITDENETNDPISIYLRKSSVPESWGDVTYYAWNKENIELLGEMRETTLYNVEYYVLTFPETVTMANIYFTDGNSRSEDVKGITKTSFYILSSLNEDSVNYIVEEEYMPDPQCLSVFLRKKSIPADWSKVYLTAWNDEGTLINTELTSSNAITVYGEDFYVYSFPKNTINVNIAFKNDDNAQTDEITDITTSTFFSLNEDLSYVRATEPIIVFLEKESASAWSTVYFYAWDSKGNELLGTFPGTIISDTAVANNGTEFYYHTFAPSISPINIIFSDGNNQTQDILGITESICYRLDGSEGTEISVSIVESDIATNIQDVDSPNTEPIEYYNLQGYRINKPGQGLYIKKQGNKITKVFF